MNVRADDFWTAFLLSRPDLDQTLSYYEAFSFGNDAGMARELAQRP